MEIKFPIDSPFYGYGYSFNMNRVISYKQNPLGYFLGYGKRYRLSNNRKGYSKRYPATHEEILNAADQLRIEIERSQTEVTNSQPVIENDYVIENDCVIAISKSSNNLDPFHSMLFKKGTTIKDAITAVEAVTGSPNIDNLFVLLLEKDPIWRKINRTAEVVMKYSLV